MKPIPQAEGHPAAQPQAECHDLRWMDSAGHGL